MMMIGTLALTGVGIPFTSIGFAGYVSKDPIIEAAFASQRYGSVYAFWCVAIAAGFTSFYSWRLVFMTFFGNRGDFAAWLPPEGHEVDARAHDEPDLTHPVPADHAREVHDDTTAHPPHDAHDHGHEPHPAHESPPVMLIPLAILALGAAFAGLVFRHWFIGERLRQLLAQFLVPRP